MTLKTSGTSNIWGTNTTQFFYELSPDLILSTVESKGFKTTGRVMTMNSMENRVYEVEIESDSDNPSAHFKIIKFYRPGRWSKDQLQEEHDFLKGLVEYEVPVIAPIGFPTKTLFTAVTSENLNLNYTIFNKQGGRAPDEFSFPEIEQVGRLLARLHSVGAMKKSLHRLKLSPDIYLKSNLDFLLDQRIIPNHLELDFKLVIEKIYDLSKNSFNNTDFLRIHGDCHVGNLLRRDDIFHLIDFDDMVVGPAVQDMWLLLPGRDEHSQILRSHLVDAYLTMRDFNEEELRLTEVLRSFRLVNYASWIAKRYEDPAFKNAFPYFESPNYWEGQINDLRDQVFYLEELQSGAN